MIICTMTYPRIDGSILRQDLPESLQLQAETLGDDEAVVEVDVGGQPLVLLVIVHVTSGPLTLTSDTS